MPALRLLCARFGLSIQALIAALLAVPGDAAPSVAENGIVQDGLSGRHGGRPSIFSDFLRFQMDFPIVLNKNLFPVQAFFNAMPARSLVLTLKAFAVALALALTMQRASSLAN